MNQKIVTMATSISSRVVLLSLYAIALTPIIIGTSMIFPMVFPKAMFALAWSAVAIASALVWWTVMPHARPRADIFTAIMTAYAIILLLATIFSVHPTRALWSTAERATGVIFMLAMFSVSVVAASYFRALPHHLTRYVQYLCGVSILVACGAVLQIIDPTALYNISHRPASTFGNPMYLGGYAGMMLALSLYGVFAWWKTWGRYLALIGVLLNAVALVASASRGAFLATGVVTLLAYGWVVLKNWNGRYQTYARVSIGVVALVIGIGAALVWYNPNTGLLKTTTLQSRKIAWNIALRGAAEHPILGWGPEHFYYVFNKHFDPRSLLFGSYETWFDRAHNTPIELLATTGAVGFIAYLMQYALWWWGALRRPRNWLLVACAAALGVNFVQNLVAFDHPGSLVMVYVIAGIIAAQHDSIKQEEKKPPRWWIAAVIATFALLIAAGAGIFFMIKKNRLVLLGKSYAASGFPSHATTMFEQAKKIRGPYAEDALFEIGKSLKDTVSLEELIARDPLHLQGQLLYAEILAADQPEKSLQKYEDAAQISPRRQTIYQSQALLLSKLGKRQEALAAAQHAIDLEPREPTSHWYAAIVATPLAGGRALAELELALKLGFQIVGVHNHVAAARIYAQQERHQEAALWIDRALGASRPADWTPQIAQFGYEVAQRAGRVDIQLKLEHIRIPPSGP